MLSNLYRDVRELVCPLKQVRMEQYGMERGNTSTVVVVVARALIRITSLAFCLWSLGWVYAAAQSKPADQAPTVLWSVEVLQNLRGSRNGSALLVRDSNRAGVAFLDEKMLLAYEVDLDTKSLGLFRACSTLRRDLDFGGRTSFLSGGTHPSN